MLALELRTNLSLLNKVTIAKKKNEKTVKVSEDANADLELQVTEAKFIQRFLPLIKTDTLMGVLILIGEGETLRRRLHISNPDKNFDQLAIDAIRKHQTLGALATLDHKYLTNTRFSVRLGNLKKDFESLLTIVNASQTIPWHRRFLNLFG